MATGATIMHRWFEEVWNQTRETTIDELLAPECVIYGLEHPLRGPADFKTFWREFRDTLHDIKIDVETALVDGDLQAARCVVSGKAPGSRKPVRFTGMVMVRTRGGKIVESWNNFDFDVMRQQLI